MSIAGLIELVADGLVEAVVVDNTDSPEREPTEVELYAMEAVTAGAEWLDVNVPGWTDRITRPIDGATFNDCPLGQVFGNYFDGIDKVRRSTGSFPSPASHAFSGWYNGPETPGPTPWDLLSQLWAEAVDVRRGKAAA